MSYQWSPLYLYDTTSRKDDQRRLQWPVVERRPDGDCKYIDPISLKYTGKPFPFRSPEGRVALVIEVEKARYTKLPFEHTPPT